jgi:hypothetical protein
MRARWVLAWVVWSGVAGCGVTFTPDVDAAVSGETPLDLHGVWRGCGTTLTLEESGAARYESLVAGCTGSGHYTVSGRTAQLSWDANCGEPPHGAQSAIRTATALVLVGETGRVTQYASDATPRALWQLDATDGSGHASTLAVVGGAEPGGTVLGCYWSSDHACGGLFSCGGRLENWTMDAASFHATTSCGGGCPCGAVMDGAANTSGGYDGTFTGVNCDHAFDGTLTVRRIDWN